MTTNPSQDMSVNSWNSLSKSQRHKMVLAMQEHNNALKLEIDRSQKDLVDYRSVLPEQCRELFEKEKTMLLNHYKTAELCPRVVKEGLNEGEADRMIKSIRERTEARMADDRHTRLILDRVAETERENEAMRQHIIATAQNLLGFIRN
ncbi:unnamed protein product [Caenorhabditis sp. 36 PRJEB53466]|nr:unnamed protein product [Caenorhabditis sp. 36 PRJEB53466]